MKRLIFGLLWYRVKSSYSLFRFGNNFVELSGIFTWDKGACFLILWMTQFLPNGNPRVSASFQDRERRFWKMRPAVKCLSFQKGVSVIAMPIDAFSIHCQLHNHQLHCFIPNTRCVRIHTNARIIIEAAMSVILNQSHCMCFTLLFSLCQTLAITEEPRHFSCEQHQVNRQPDFLVVPVYPDCCSPWHADFRRQVSLAFSFRSFLHWPIVPKKISMVFPDEFAYIEGFFGIFCCYLIYAHFFPDSSQMTNLRQALILIIFKTQCQPYFRQAALLRMIFFLSRVDSFHSCAFMIIFSIIITLSGIVAHFAG